MFFPSPRPVRSRSSPTRRCGGAPCLRPTPDDPPDFRLPGAADWYRFVLDAPAVSVALAAPGNRQELEADLEVLSTTGPLSAEEFERLAAHGARARRHAGNFP